MDSAQKRDRDRKNRQKRQDKEAKRRERNERKRQERTEPPAGSPEATGLAGAPVEPGPGPV